MNLCCFRYCYLLPFGYVLGARPSVLLILYWVSGILRHEMRRLDLFFQGIHMNKLHFKSFQPHLCPRSFTLPGSFFIAPYLISGVFSLFYKIFE